MKKFYLIFSIFLISIVFTACSSGMNDTSNKMMEKKDSMSDHQKRVNAIFNGGSSGGSSSSSGGSSGGHK